MKKQNGITLVALVITIIVLLILAGVSISLVMGNNGVLTQASSAVVATEKATAKSEVEMGASDALMAYWSDKATDSTVLKSDYYTLDVFENNCTSRNTAANSVTVSELSTAADTGEITVTYKTKSNITYSFTVDVATAKVGDGTVVTSDASGQN
jgi:type II secretory pathway pseudopilin PulG